MGNPVQKIVNFILNYSEKKNNNWAKPLLHSIANFSESIKKFDSRADIFHIDSILNLLSRNIKFRI